MNDPKEAGVNDLKDRRAQPPAVASMLAAKSLLLIIPGGYVRRLSGPADLAAYTSARRTSAGRTPEISVNFSVGTRSATMVEAAKV